jgi:beta-glucanase (GH16 family)
MKLVLFPLLAVSVFAQKPAANPVWVLTFVDEFEGNELDLAKWSPHDPLRSVYAAADITVSNGQLHLGKGAVVSTFGLFSQTYGKVEIRCRIAAVRGVKSAVRLLPVPLAPLPIVDVFEVDGGAPSKIAFGNHWGTEQTERSYGDSLEGPDLSADFHVVSVEWDEAKIVWSIDGKERLQAVDGLPGQRMFLLIDLQGDVDYVRIYRRG